VIVCREEAKFHDEHGDVLLNPTVIFEVFRLRLKNTIEVKSFRRYRTQIEALQDDVLGVSGPMAR